MRQLHWMNWQGDLYIQGHFMQYFVDRIMTFILILFIRPSTNYIHLIRFTVSIYYWSSDTIITEHKHWSEGSFVCFCVDMENLIGITFTNLPRLVLWLVHALLNQSNIYRVPRKLYVYWEYNTIPIFCLKFM